MKRKRKLVAVVCSVAVVFWIAASGVAAYVVTMPMARSFEDIAELAGHPVEAVVVEASDGTRISGWYVPAKGDKAIVFTHGIRSDRRQHQANMEFYLARGYSALAIDFRGHGKSDPATITMGWNERLDLLAAVDFLRQKGYEHIGADGISLGAATIAYAAQDKPDLAFVILESSYDTVDNALNNRLAMVGAPAWVATTFRWFSTRFVGVGPDKLRPLDYMKELAVPTLVLAGDNEAEIPVHETQSLYDASAAAIKDIYLFAGATHHHRLVRRHSEEYARVVDEFLARVFPPVAVEAQTASTAAP